MRIVIDIPDEVYKKISNRNPSYADDFSIYYDIKNGTPLPKGHGRLIDADKLKHAFIMWSMAQQGFFTNSDIASIVHNSPTIIEADKAESEE